MTKLDQWEKHILLSRIFRREPYSVRSGNFVLFRVIKMLRLVGIEPRPLISL